MSNEVQNIGENGLKKPNTGKLDLLKLNNTALNACLSNLEIPRLFYQLVIFIIDGSNSMYEETKNGLTKGEEIDNGIRSIIKRLKTSKNSNSFDISLLVFSDDFKDVFSVKNVKEISSDQSFNPLNYITPQGTKLNDALLYTSNIIRDYHQKNNNKNCQVLVQILSDGAMHDYSSSLESIETIKNTKHTTVACQFLESHIEENQEWYSSNEETGEIDYSSPWTIDEVREDEAKISDRFKSFASNEHFFMTSIDPEEIRKHMIKSISTVSKLD